VTTLYPCTFFKNPLIEFSVASGNTAFIAKDLFLLSKDEKTLIAYYGSAKDIAVPNTVTVIGEHAFSYRQLTSVTIPSSVTAIKKYAFYENELASIVIPDNVTKIEDYAFFNNQLTSIVIPGSVTAIGPAAFSRNPLTEISVAANNTEYVAKDSFFLSKDEKLLIAYYGSAKDITIPNTVTAIEQSAFSNNQLTSVIIPGSVTMIGEFAFAENQLTSITIGANVDIYVCDMNIMSEVTSYEFFLNTYNSTGKEAGTYILRDGVWSRQ
jgi:hypothetical protein